MLLSLYLHGLPVELVFTLHGQLDLDYRSKGGKCGAFGCC